jgi:hypothetical protein
MRWPSTRLGWWSFGLAAACVVLSIMIPALIKAAAVTEPSAQVAVPSFGIFILLCGLPAGIVGLIAVTRQRECSWLVWFAILLGFSVLVLALREFLTALVSATLPNIGST